jgi:hypothetical protein
VLYWVAYQRGSFSIKERYPCPDLARARCNTLITHAQYIRIVPTPDGEDERLLHCFELPPALNS